MTGLPIWCPPCGMATQHDAGGDLVRCRACGHTRPNDVPLLAAQVEAVEYCRWCREHVIGVHACPYASAPCPNEDGNDCGACDRCIALQESALRYGSPSDLDGGAA